MTSKSLYYKVALAATLLALVVVVLGAYVRLSHAGLGCPDWPGCYGHIGAPEADHHVEAANQAYPERPVEAAKAWKEMIHRYVAGTLGLFILWLAIMAWRRRAEPGQPVALPSFLVLLVIFQALLGMWTVTLLLYPAVVTAHLLFGFTTLALLWWLSSRGLGLYGDGAAPGDGWLRPLAVLGLVLVVIQVLLGGWTSSNYAALACPDFPTCQAVWWPEMDFREGFSLLHKVGLDYEGGLLDGPARTAIHMGHRIGALVVFLLVIDIAVLTLIKAATPAARRIAVAIIVLLLVQVGLGITNVLAGLPLVVAAAHNGVGALLLLSLVSLNLSLVPRRSGG